ncbi:hypothetical protein U0C82_08560 [Fulvimarina sp. 2208YS6-2-32]|uniref:Uncharacterized protein n=1 Tax=Fulvimarina uroteuthidis TaxID=3098149 RepID=A0ABU5I2Y3_9HYPH|nr:hypothetical protein [Fulvimarina sp. 2208YS6-2-32]MDY8109194.1 hypothetical protein [Fulvimarina sp. 2208YS6-2-32]
MSRVKTLGLATLVAFGAIASAPAMAAGDKTFFRQVAGKWSGPGEIVAGKYKGTKFNCSFDGLEHAKKVGVVLDGSCRVGMFAQPMRAEVVQSGSGYRGAFQDGAKGKGLDIISGEVNGNKMVVGLDRAQLKGAMVARLADGETMAITVSVRVAGQLVPVIGMNLKRAGGVRQTSLEQ